VTFIIDTNDVNSNPFLFPALSEVIPDVKVGPLNPDKPDILMTDYEGKEIGISLKQVGEILSGLSAVTEQLQRDSRHVDQLYLVVTGVMVPSGQGVLTLESSSTGAWYTKGKFWQGGNRLAREPYHFSLLGYEKWKQTLGLYGITVKEPPNKDAQVTAIQAIWESHQLPPEEHESFSRVIRPKLNLPAEASPFVKSLMGLCDAQTGRTFIGQQYAEALQSRAGGIVNLLNMDEQDIAETRLASGRRIGPAMARRIKEALG
jgi:hypothetical protein